MQGERAVGVNEWLFLRRIVSRLIQSQWIVMGGLVQVLLISIIATDLTLA